MKQARAIVFLGAGIWCAAIVSAPLFGLGFVYDFFSRICHQIPNRSWTLGGAQLPVCVRCASIYFGFLLASLFMPRPSFRFLQAALAATLLELAVAHVALDSPWPRSATGMALGASLAPFVIAGFHDMWRKYGVARGAV